jgi:glutathione S-transferase
VPESDRTWARRAAAGTLLAADQEALVRAELVRKLERVEAGLAGRAWLVGDAFTLADAVLWSRLAAFPALGLPLDAASHPAIASWMTRIAARPSVAAEREARAA